MKPQPAVTGPQFICDYILLKLASRCNIKCAYCYWFRDRTVLQTPALLQPEVEAAFLQRLESHIRQHNLQSFIILFHGGEPLLFGKGRFAGLCQKLRALEQRLGFRLSLGVTTNGILIDSEWAQLLADYDVRVSLSVDGPQHVHDHSRINFRGMGTFDAVVLALQTLRTNGVEPALLAVCHPNSNPKEVADFFVHTLAVKNFDILVPDAIHEDSPLSIRNYYQQLFDLWYDEYSSLGVRIRFIESIVKGLLGRSSNLESIGYGAITLSTILTDGSIEPLDTLRIAGNGTTRTQYNILTHDLQAIQNDPLWQEIRNASLHVAPICQSCVYKHACGGGPMNSRWSNNNRYNNPSVYCEDIKHILGHAWNRLCEDLYADVHKSAVPLRELTVLRG